MFYKLIVVSIIAQREYKLAINLVTSDANHIRTHALTHVSDISHAGARFW